MRWLVDAARKRGEKSMAQIRTWDPAGFYADQQHDVLAFQILRNFRGYPKLESYLTRNELTFGLT
jgi:DNA-directed RNA polymerase specialized sigma54-like protein